MPSVVSDAPPIAWSKIIGKFNVCLLNVPGDHILIPATEKNLMNSHWVRRSPGLQFIRNGWRRDMMPAMQMPMNPMSSGMMPMMGGNMMPMMMPMMGGNMMPGMMPMMGGNMMPMMPMM